MNPWTPVVVTVLVQLLGLAVYAGIFWARLREHERRLGSVEGTVSTHTADIHYMKGKIA
ncbi:MAG: hypothetical protein AB7O65_14290 [Candidatus Korobacteraceae bacterium]